MTVSRDVMIELKKNGTLTVLYIGACSRRHNAWTLGFRFASGVVVVGRYATGGRASAWRLSFGWIFFSTWRAVPTRELGLTEPGRTLQEALSVARPRRRRRAADGKSAVYSLSPSWIGRMYSLERRDAMGHDAGQGCDAPGATRKPPLGLLSRLWSALSCDCSGKFSTKNPLTLVASLREGTWLCR